MPRMPIPFLALALALAIVPPAAAHAPAAGFSVHVSPALRGREPAFRKAIAAARDEAIAWFARAGYPVAPADVVREAHVFDAAHVRAGVAKAADVPLAGVPTSFGGTVLDGVLLVVDPAGFRANWRKLYPDRPWTDRAWHQLLVHELAHQAHARVARDRLGDEEKMGPRWFFEGLAITVANQFPGQAPLDGKAVWQLMRDDGRDVKIAYPDYRRMLDAVRRIRSDRDLIDHAGDQDFEGRLADGLGAL